MPYGTVHFCRGLQTGIVAQSPRGPDWERLFPRVSATSVQSGWVRYRLPRSLHPIAWWVWALGVMTTASLTTNPLIEALLLAVTTFVVVARRDDGPWARSFRLYAALALAVFVLRILYRVVFGGGDGDTILFRLPAIPLPEVVAGIRLLGPVSLESLLTGAYDGLRLATIIVAVGAANSLASPRRLLQSMPAALYEIGTVLVIAVTVFPQLGESVVRVARARQLRTSTIRGRTWRSRARFVRGLIVPVLADALDSAIALAASMDSRGFGRSGVASRRHRMVAATAALAALGCLMLFAYDLITSTLPSATVAALAVTLRLRDLLGLLGVVLAVVSVRFSGQGVHRSRYRPDRWRVPELLTVLCGLVPVVAILSVSSTTGAAVLYPALLPTPEVPVLPTAVLAGALVALLPAVITPPAPIGAEVPA